MKLKTNLMLILSMLALLIGSFSGCANTPITEESVLEVPANPEVNDSDHADIILISYPAIPAIEVCIPVMKEAFQRTDIQVEFQSYPVERSLQIANYGKTHGELSRIKGIDKNYENLIQIPVANNFVRLFPITLDADIQITSIEDLKLYHIGSVRGTKLVENAAADLNIEWANDNESLFSLMDNGRIDIVLSTDLVFHEMKQSSSLDYSEDIRLAGDYLLEAELYPYIHKDYPELIENLTKVLKEMEAEGRIEELLKDEKEKMFNK